MAIFIIETQSRRPGSSFSFIVDFRRELWYKINIQRHVLFLIIRKYFYKRGNTMKQIIFTLCVFFALITVADSAELYNCAGPDGNVFFTDNPPQDAKCKNTSGDDVNTSQQQQTEDEDKQTGQDDENKSQTGKIKKLIKIPRPSY
ncbi:hypothetical protein ER57_04095 [Smithella sp. SCADC]|nr:hypothetical protein ER57_04095 [Smithella sp. SCADC]